MDEFEDFLWRLSRQLMNMVGPQAAYRAEPYVELSEGDGGVLLTAETPGVKAGDLRVRVSADRIRLSVVENGFTVYSGVYETGKIKPGEAVIQYRNGVLEVRVPYAKTLF
jgi:HSP20 family molecular chaperone IbpA